MKKPKVTKCPPGYAHGYSPEGEISALDRDTMTVTASMVGLRVAGKWGSQAAERYENKAQAMIADLFNANIGNQQPVPFSIRLR